MKNDALINLADNLKTKGLDKNSRREIANQGAERAIARERGDKASKRTGGGRAVA